MLSGEFSKFTALVVPFSIALINQASCAADLKQFFSQYSQVLFLLLRSYEYKPTTTSRYASPLLA